VTKATTPWPIVEKSQRSNITKRSNMGPRLFQGKKTSFFLLKKIKALKKQLKSAMEENPKRGRPNPYSQLKLM
jgi:hypothetical protein